MIQKGKSILSMFSGTSPGDIMPCMQEFPVVKIEIFIPEEYVERLNDELSKVGAGRIGNYDHCMSLMQVKGFWRPLKGANPFLGEVGEISRGEECKVEVNCAWEFVKAALEAIRRIHPYEEPVINIVPLLNHEFFI
jgi:hypothetical protein